jgi:hypothetical protein
MNILAEMGAGRLRVRATRKIEQSPLNDSPCVPEGLVGWLEDQEGETDYVFVDFGTEYGVVLTCVDEIESVERKTR